MNYRIKLLAEQAGFIFWEDEHWGPGPGHICWDGGYDDEFDRYTRLIIETCSEVAGLESEPAKQAIQQYFRVKMGVFDGS